MSVIDRALVLVCLWSAMARAASTHRLIVALDTGESPPPGYVCVIESDDACSDKKKCEMTPLKKLRYERANRPDRTYTNKQAEDTAAHVHAPLQFSTSELCRSDTSDSDEAKASLCSAVASLTQRGTSCLGCAPTLELPELLYDDKNAPIARLSCGRNTAGGDRVAFIYLSFSQIDGAASIQNIELVGSVATLEFKEGFKETAYPIAQAIGGDYAPSSSSTFGTRERLQMSLHPRCSMVPLELPANVSANRLGKATSVTKDPVSTVTDSCPIVANGETLFANVPYAAADAHVTLSTPVTHFEQGTNRRVEDSVLQVSWSGSTPPTSLRMAMQKVNFTWSTSCMSSDWGQDALGRMAHGWSGSCPRATIEGAKCELETASDATKVCQYGCTGGAVPLTFPLHVHFDRMHSADIVFSWDDVVREFDQALMSFAPPESRRLVLTLDPNAWKAQDVEQLEVVLPDGVGRRVDLKSPWSAIATPGLDCTDTVRVRIHGPHVYEDQPFDVTTGTVPLKSPAVYRNKHHVAALAGLNVAVPFNAEQQGADAHLRFGTTATVGLVGERYRPSGNALEVEVTSNTGRSTFPERINSTTASLTEVWYERWQAQATYENWWSHRFHFGGSLGGGLGLPLLDSDDDRFGALRFYTTAQANVRFGVGAQWLEFIVGIRLLEHRTFYAPDAAGTLNAEQRMITTFYSGARYRLSLF